jgi:16S rRNA (cytidine1402-2'-O)-methyltransferase
MHAPKPAASRGDSGTLFVVATPIGNLGDISARALRGPRPGGGDLRRGHPPHPPAARPLRHRAPAAGAARAQRAGAGALLVERLRGGDSLALVSDAGTPLVSDPGFRLVRAAREAGLRVSPVPGACAAIAALSVAGLPSDRFVFEGFLPAKAGARRERLARLAGEPRTLVFYESAHRIEASLVGHGRRLRPRPAGGAGARADQAVRDRARRQPGQLQARVAADPDQRRGEFVLLVQGAGDDADARLAEGRRLYRVLSGAPAAFDRGQAGGRAQRRAPQIAVRRRARLTLSKRCGPVGGASAAGGCRVRQFPGGVGQAVASSRSRGAEESPGSTGHGAR